MRLSFCTHATVFHVVRHMRAIDYREIYALRFEENPFVITNEAMAQANYAWVAWHGDEPAVVFGGALLHPGVWQMFCFGTDAFPRLALGLTRFARKTIIPQLFGELGAHRLQADSHQDHTEAHRWLEALGATRESVKERFGRDGSNYFHYRILRPVDSCDPTE